MTWTGFSPGFRPSRGFLLGRFCCWPVPDVFRPFPHVFLCRSHVDAPSLEAQFAIACKENLPSISRLKAGLA